MKMRAEKTIRSPRWALVGFGMILAIHGAARVAKAEEPLVTDRPDFTESSSTVGRGVFQLEAGTTYSEFAGGTDVTTLGEVLARWGVTEYLELRFQLPTYEWDSGSSGSHSGFVNSGVGIKLDLASGEGSGFLGGMLGGAVTGVLLELIGVHLGDFRQTS